MSKTTMPTSATMAPTDRSMPRVRIGNDSPIASIAMNEKPPIRSSILLADANRSAKRLNTAIASAKKTTSAIVATIALVVFFALAMAVFSLFADRFASASNMEDLMGGFSFIAILAMGESFPILTRGIDLSVGAIVALVGMVVFDMSLIFHVPGYIVIP